MCVDQPYVELFLPKLKEAREKDSKLDAACIKIDSKLKEYARGRSLRPEQLKLLDVCDANAKIHPKLRQYIESIPKLKNQTDARHKKYKEEISANIQRAINSVIILLVTLPEISTIEN